MSTLTTDTHTEVVNKRDKFMTSALEIRNGKGFHLDFIMNKSQRPKEMGQEVLKYEMRAKST